MILSNISIFFFSILLSFAMFLVENIYGFDPFYHPDVSTYIFNAPDFDTISFSDYFPGQFYFILSSFVNADYFTLVIINVLVYASTNVVLFQLVSRFPFKKNLLGLILFSFFVFSPYRIHLSIVPLKDTIIIFFVSLLFINPLLIKFLSFFSLLAFSIRSFVYVPSFLNFRLNYQAIVFLILLITIFLLLFDSSLIFDLLSTESQVDMNFRGYDFVPVFSEFGAFGAFLRFLLWPFLSLTGVYNLFSFNFFVFIVSISPIFLQLWAFFSFRSFCFPLPVFISLGILAYLVPGFTSFLRYSLPLITISPIVFLIIRFDNNAK